MTRLALHPVGMSHRPGAVAALATGQGPRICPAHPGPARHPRMSQPGLGPVVTWRP